MKEKTLTLGEVEQFCNEHYEDVLELNSVQDVKDLIGCHNVTYNITNNATKISLPVQCPGTYM
eukprot:COSAG01_NODE_2390_length_7729_cov_9.189837_3_plen_63_part_00